MGNYHQTHTHSGSPHTPCDPTTYSLQWDETPYESLHTVVSSGIKPWFDVFIRTKAGVSGKDGDSKLQDGDTNDEEKLCGA